MTSRERVLKAVNHQVPDRVPIDLGGMKASGIGVRAYNRVKARVGNRTSTRIWDPRFMIACVDEEMRQRFHVDVVPLDASSSAHEQQPDCDWIPMALYEGAEGLLPPGTSVGTDVDGNWVMLDPDGRPTSFRMSRTGHYFDDIAFDRPGASIDPAAFRPTFADLWALQEPPALAEAHPEGRRLNSA